MRRLWKRLPQPRSRRFGALLFAATLLLSLPALASADAPPGPYFNGFETNTAGWFNNGGGTITRVPSGSSSTYANGVAAATGNYYARLGIDPNADSCDAAGGPFPVYEAPFTRWGGYSAIFPPGGYSTGVDIYLDVPFALAHPDRRFDWSSAISNASGGFRRDFVFNVGTDVLGFVINGSNNATRCGANPYGGSSIHITQSGWYTFQHDFTGVSGGPLIVVLTVRDSSTNAVLGTWIRSDPSDIIGVTVGGNRYGWFVQNEFDGLAIDNSFRTGLLSTPGCEIKISDGGWIVADNGDQATFGGNAKVSASGDASGQQEYQDHGPAQPINFKATTVAAVICNGDRTSAEVYGSGTVDGLGAFTYRINLVDNGEPGTSDEYGIIIPGVGYASGDQTLQGGNIQIR